MRPNYFIMNVTNANNYTTFNQSAIEEMLRLLLIYRELKAIEAENCTTYCGGNMMEMLNSYKNIHGYLALVICAFGIISNVLNITVLTRQVMWHIAINKILTWLAAADTLLMLEYIPFSIFNLVTHKEATFTYGSAVYMLIHMHITQILHTSSIFLTMTLAIWRYIAIRHPHAECFRYIQTRCSEVIIGSLFVAAILWVPTSFAFKVNKKIHPDGEWIYVLDASKDTTLYRVNFWVHAVMIKLLPCVALTIITMSLICVLYEASKRRQMLKRRNVEHLNQLNGNRYDHRSERTTMLLVIILVLFLITEFPQGILGLLSGIRGRCFFAKCYYLFGEVMDILALINSAVGFVLYGLMSNQFRTSFQLLFFR